MTRSGRYPPARSAMPSGIADAPTCSWMVARVFLGFALDHLEDARVRPRQHLEIGRGGALELTLHDGHLGLKHLALLFDKERAIRGSDDVPCEVGVPRQGPAADLRRTRQQTVLEHPLECPRLGSLHILTFEELFEQPRRLVLPERVGDLIGEDLLGVEDKL